MLNRRGFAVATVGTLAAAGFAKAGAQPADGPFRESSDLREGRDFVRVSPPQPAPDGGRIEVIEFFWYGCPHCAAFEPTLAAWQQRQPSNVTLRRVPVAFREVPYVAHQQLFYALEALGRLPTLHMKVFETIHRDHVRLDTPAAIADFAAAQHIPMADFLQAYGSFAVQARAHEATRLMRAYAVDGVPSFGVQGRYFTSGTLAGSPDRSLAVVDRLIERVRSGG